MMRILVGDKGNVDFDEPIKATEEQKKAIVDFLKSIFRVVQLENVDYHRTERIGAKLFQRIWFPEEYSILLEAEDTYKVAEMLGRSWMSIDIKRGDFIPEFLQWAHERGKDIIQGNNKDLIEEFMKEKQNELLKRKSKRQKIRKKQKEIQELRNKLEDWDSSEKRKKIEFGIFTNQIEEKTPEEYIKKRKSEILEKIKSLEKEI